MVKAAVISAPKSEPELIDLPRPELESGSVLLRTLYSEVCGTDVHLFHGRLPEAPYPLIPGHISVGEVLDMRGEIHTPDGEEITRGEVVTFLDVHGTCNDCWYCLVARASTRCPQRRVYGITYGAEDGLLGGWSEEIYLKPGVKIVKLGIDPRQFMAGGCGLPTAYHAVERADISLGDTVVIQGSGPVGLNAVILARLAGAIRIILVGAPQKRLEVGLNLGADYILDINQITPDERVAKIKELTGGRGADVTIEATGVPRAVVEGMQYTRDAGTCVVAGQYTDAGDITLNPHHLLNKKHLDLRAVWGIDYSHFYRSIQVMEYFSDQVDWGQMVTHEYPLEGASQALADVEEGLAVKAVIRPNA